jgi:phosphate butyryltransferase
MECNDLQQLSFSTLLENIKSKSPVRIAAAGAGKAELLEALKRIQDEGLAEFTLIGETTWIFQMASRVDLKMAKVKLIEESLLELPAAQVAVEEARRGRAQLLINGFVSSTHMLQAVMDSKKGIRIPRTSFSQLTALELSGYSKLFFITDTGIHTKPNALAQKEILENTLLYLRHLGMEKIRVAMLKGTPILEGMGSRGKAQMPFEGVSPLLEELKGRYPEMILQGPLTLEESMTGEIPDVFLVPNSEVGQILSHALSVFADGKAGYIILGAKVPIVLTTNNSTEEQLWRSLLLALNAAQ